MRMQRYGKREKYTHGVRLVSLSLERMLFMVMMPAAKYDIQNISEP